MNTEKLKADLNSLLSTAGIHINGPKPWDIKVYNDDFYSRALANGSLGAGEAYIEGWWDCRQLDEFFFRVLNAGLEEKVKTHWGFLTDIFLTKLINRQSRTLSFQNGQKHYDLGNDLFIHMLDKRMTYTCAYWKDAVSLDMAQEHKLQLTCKKLNLQPGMRVLDIGCGWGSFAKYAAEHYDVTVTGITVSRDQVELGQKMCAGLPVEILLRDYRDMDETFDRVVSLGMFEHVGFKNYRRFMRVAHRCLADGGLFLLHTIGGNKSQTAIDPWIDKYIFPGAMLPSIRQIGESIEGLFVMEDWHNFGANYDKTLMAWHDNFVHHWNDLKSRYDDRFFRIWKYYLLMCAGTFRSRKNQLWQIVFSKHGVPGGYDSIR